MLIQYVIFYCAIHAAHTQIKHVDEHTFTPHSYKRHIRHHKDNTTSHIIVGDAVLRMLTRGQTNLLFLKLLSY